MNSQEKELYQRIKNFVFDDPTADFTFTQKLMKETGWTQEFTQKAIEEYKKFTFLAMVSNHEVSPSEIVDQVWHLHLIYTHSYWQEFCPKILGKPLHHNPSKGGINETSKYREIYRKTLASYEFYFGECPPTDIWIPPHLYQVKNNKFNLFSLLKNIKLSPQKKLTILLYLFVTLTITGCETIINPLNLTGTVFLQLYLLIASLFLFLSFIFRFYFNKPSSNPHSSIPDLNHYEIAYLSEGSQRTVECAIASLVERKILKVVVEPRSLEIIAPLDNIDNLLEITIINAIKSQNQESKKFGSIIIKAKPFFNTIQEKLENLGLLADQKRFQTVRFWTNTLPILGVLLFGGLKVSVGLSRHKPVGFLVILLIITLILGLILSIKPVRSNWGDDFLESLKRQYGSTSQYSLAVALFGLQVLVGTSLADLYTVLFPPTTGGSGGCSSGGCSSGGCGGGGCGGCSG